MDTRQSFMRKPLAILLISVHLVGNTEAGQLFKLPQLLSHFFQHHQLDTSINFFDFIAMHYGGNDGTTADDDVYSPMVKVILPIEFSSWETNEYNSRLQTGTSSKHVLLILQPPRLV